MIAWPRVPDWCKKRDPEYPVFDESVTQSTWHGKKKLWITILRDPECLPSVTQSALFCDPEYLSRQGLLSHLGWSQAQKLSAVDVQYRVCGSSGFKVFTSNVPCYGLKMHLCLNHHPKICITPWFIWILLTISYPEYLRKSRVCVTQSTCHPFKMWPNC